VNLLTSLVPWPYRLLVMILFAAALFGAGWAKGSMSVQSEWDAAISKQTVQVAQVKQHQAEVTTEVVTKYVDKIKLVHDQGETIIKEVTHYVPSDSCILPAGFRLLHDAAASGELPAAARSADAQPVTAQTVAATIATNYQQSREIATQLEALQEWVRRQSLIPK